MREVFMKWERLKSSLKVLILTGIAYIIAMFIKEPTTQMLATIAFITSIIYDEYLFLKNCRVTNLRSKNAISVKSMMSTMIYYCIMVIILFISVITLYILLL